MYNDKDALADWLRWFIKGNLQDIEFPDEVDPRFGAFQYIQNFIIGHALPLEQVIEFWDDLVKETDPEWPFGHLECGLKISTHIVNVTAELEARIDLDTSIPDF